MEEKEHKQTELTSIGGTLAFVSEKATRDVKIWMGIAEVFLAWTLEHLFKEKLNKSCALYNVETLSQPPLIALIMEVPDDLQSEDGVPLGDIVEDLIGQAGCSFGVVVVTPKGDVLHIKPDVAETIKQKLQEVLFSPEAASVFLEPIKE